MKIRILLTIALGVVAACLLFWLSRDSGHRQRLDDETRVISEAVSNVGKIRTAAGPSEFVDPNSPINASTSAVPNQKDPLSARESVERTVARFNEDFKKPIVFYGRVVDEQETSVAAAEIVFSWTDLSPNGTSTAKTFSDTNGLFSLTGVTGRGLLVRVSKDGYYTQASNQIHFQYAHEDEADFHHPDPSTPIIFRLRKRGLGAELITSQYGVTPNFDVSPPRDGSPLLVDLINRKAGNTGQLEIRQVKPQRKDLKDVSEWSFSMAINDGGFIEQNDEFAFEAPEHGYQSVVAFSFKPGQTNWTVLLKKNYYISFGQPRRYGRLTVETRMASGVRLSYAINPTGSRYLEPKESSLPPRPPLEPGMVEIVPGRPDLSRTN